jgi:hypothetical protein
MLRSEGSRSKGARALGETNMKVRAIAKFEAQRLCRARSCARASARVGEAVRASSQRQ